MRFTLGLQVIVAIVLGCAVGLLFGHYTVFLQPIGEIYFMLLQMIILPYIPVLLIHGIGSLTPSIAKKLLMHKWRFILLLWFCGFLAVFLLSQLIPTPSTVFIDPQSEKQADLIGHFLQFVIPKNFFYDLSNNIVPAISIFGLIAGFAVMFLKEKEPLLSFFSRMNASIEIILQWLAMASPIAIFAHIAVAIGTVSFGDLGKVEFYVVTFILGVLFLTFWVLPVILTSLTKLTYREVMREFRVVCLVPFATAIPSIAFPFIYKSIKRISEKAGFEDRHYTAQAQTVLPLAYTFGQLGNFFILFIILFLSFYTRHALTQTDAIIIPLLTVPMSLGSVYSSINAVQFLIGRLGFSLDSYTLFQQTSTVLLNFQVLLSIASVLTLVILALCAYYGRLKARWLSLAWHLVLAFGVFAGSIFAIRPFLNIQDNFSDLYMHLQVADVFKSPPPVKVYAEGEMVPLPENPNESPLQRVLRTGVLRVGFDHVDIPFAYFNAEGQIAGFDVTFAYELARDLNCRLEFVPMNPQIIGEQLNTGLYDIAMSAIVMDLERIQQMSFVKPYFQQSFVLVVPLKNKNQYENYDNVVNMEGIKIGGAGAYYDYIKRDFPKADLTLIPDLTPLVDGKIDAVLWTYVSAFIWSLHHPDFTVIDYGFSLGKQYFSYAIREETSEWYRFLQNWMSLKDLSGFAEVQRRYWIRGITPEEAKATPSFTSGL